MRNRVSLFLLVLCMLCQSLAMAGQMALAQLGGDLKAEEHALMHWHGEPHHHGDHEADVAAHVDDTSESYGHLLIDEGLQVAALIQFDFSVRTSERPPRPVVHSEFTPPPPHLEGLRRPPRLLS